MPYVRKTRKLKNDNILERGDGFHRFQGELIRAIKKQDSRTFGMSLQNSKKYKSHKIKKKRLCK